MSLELIIVPGLSLERLRVKRFRSNYRCVVEMNDGDGSQSEVLIDTKRIKHE